MSIAAKYICVSISFVIYFTIRLFHYETIKKLTFVQAARANRDAPMTQSKR